MISSTSTRLLNAKKRCLFHSLSSSSLLSLSSSFSPSSSTSCSSFFSRSFSSNKNDNNNNNNNNINNDDDDDDGNYVTQETKGSTLWVIIDRPKVANAFNEDVIDQITDTFNNIDTNKYRSVVLTGRGKAFSAGADLNWMKSMVNYSELENKEDSLRLFDMVHSIRSCPLPVIGRINGAAMGGGSGLVAACDMAFAVSKAKFAFTEVKLGLIPAVISRFVMDKIGTANAARYFLTGELFSSKEAKRIGLIQNDCETVEELDQCVDDIVRTIHNNSPAAVKTCKNLIENVSKFENVAATRDFVAGEIAKARVSEEGQEGLTAFLSKRKPAWME